VAGNRHSLFLKVEIMKTFKNPPQGTTIVSEKNLRLQEFYANQYLSDLEYYDVLKTAHNSEKIFTRTPSKKVWGTFNKLFGKEAVGRAYRFWLSNSRQI